MSKAIIYDSITGETKVIEIVEDEIDFIDYKREIELCKKRLRETDYVVIKIAEGASTVNDYADIIQERQNLRDLINSYEIKEKEQNERLSNH